MKKLFTLFAAMLLTVAVNADRFEITPTKWKGGTVADRTLYRTLDATQSGINPGDTIVLATGTYNESSSMNINSDVVIMAANGAAPLVQCGGYFDLNASAVIKGIKFQFVGDAGSGYGIYVHGTGHKYIKLDSCEFYDYPKPCIEESSSYHVDSVLINNCKFHDIAGSCLLLKETGDCRVIIKNSTFANIGNSTLEASAVDIRTDVGIVKVDNCTFYNCLAKNYDYAAIKSPSSSNSNILISNCILTLPGTAPTTVRAIHMQGSKVIKNCLTFNYSNGSDKTGMRSGTFENCLTNQDPLYTDSATCNFTLSESSPAHEAGLNGTHLGDPRWWPSSWQPAAVVPVTGIALDESELEIEVDDIGVLTATVSPDNATDKSVTWTSSNTSVATVNGGVVSALAIGTTTITAMAGDKSTTCAVTVSAATKPSTDFSSALVLAGRKAHIEGNIWKNSDYNLYYSNKSTQGVASWEITVTKPCYVTGTVNGVVKNGQWFELDLYDSEDNRIDSIANPVSRAWSKNDIALDSTGHSILFFPAAGNYTLKLRNEMQWSSAEFVGITLTKDASKEVIFKGDWDSWTEHTATYSADGSYASVTINLGVFNEKEFGLTVGGVFKANGYGYHRGYTGTAGITTSSPNMKLTTDYAGAYTFKWYYANDSMAIVFPEKTLEDGFYLVGTFDGVSAWDIEDLDASKLFVWNKKVGDNDEYKLTLNLAEGDAFKVRAVSKGVMGYYYPNGSDNDYVVNNALAGNVTIYFRPAGDGGDDWHYHVIYCVRNGEPTAIDETVVGEKAVKFFRNGQLFIEKDGKTYNVLGTVVK